MPDYLPSLHLIAVSLMRLSQESSFSWVSVLVPVATTLLSVFAGWGMSQWSYRLKERAQRDMVIKLLRDEIRFRWREKIGAHLTHIMSRGEWKDGLRAIASIEVEVSDLFICNLVSSTFPSAYFIGTADLVSKIIHTSVLMRDLVHITKVSKQLTTQLDDPTVQLQGPNIWRQFRECVDGLNACLSFAGRALGIPETQAQTTGQAVI
jgi:hypothetical protein